MNGGIVVEINGAYAPIVGRICMDQCMVDVTGLNNVVVGAAVTVYGCDEYTSIDRIAKRNNTINYEITCALGERVPRAYKRNGVIEKITDYTINL